MSPAELVTKTPLLSEHVVHAAVVVIVIVCATVLRSQNALDNNTISIVFGTAIGYAAGRSGTRPAAPSRRSDNGSSS